MKGQKGKDSNQMYSGELLSVEIKVVTWGKDSHGLFDYESKSLNQKRFVLDSTTQFFRDPTSKIVTDPDSNVEIKTIDEQKRDKLPTSELPLLAEIVRRDGPQSDGTNTILYSSLLIQGRKLEGGRRHGDWEPHIKTLSHCP